MYELLHREEARQHGTIAHIGQRHTIDDMPVGHWVTTQRAKHRQGRLTPERTTALGAWVSNHE